jgi:hypothetical protein
MADHDGVEVGTIETLLWRARHALKREFNVLAESKGAFAGALIGVGAIVRKGLLRVAHRAAAFVPTTGAAGAAFRGVVAGAAVTSAAVAAALISPHVVSSAPSTASSPHAVASAAAGTGAVGAGRSLPALGAGAGSRTGANEALPGHASGFGAGTTIGPISANAAAGTAGAGALAGAVGAAIEPLLGQLGQGVQPSAGAAGSPRLGAVAVAGIPAAPSTNPPIGALPPAISATVPRVRNDIGLPTSGGATSGTSGSGGTWITTGPAMATTTLPLLNSIGATVKGVLGQG